MENLFKRILDEYSIIDDTDFEEVVSEDTSEVVEEPKKEELKENKECIQEEYNVNQLLLEGEGLLPINMLMAMSPKDVFRFPDLNILEYCIRFLVTKGIINPEQKEHLKEIYKELPTDIQRTYVYTEAVEAGSEKLRIELRVQAEGIEFAAKRILQCIDDEQGLNFDNIKSLLSQIERHSREVENLVVKPV